MAVLTNDELDYLRQTLQRFNSVNATKPQINAATQAVVNLLEQPSTQTAVNNAIEGAAAGVFTAEQKRKIFVLATLITAKQHGVI